MSGPRPAWVRVLIGVAVAAVIGVTVFGFMAWRATTVTSVAALEARAEFDAVAVRFGSTQPRIILDAEGGPTRNPQAPAAIPGPVSTLVVVVWRKAPEQLVRSEVPFWFFRLKGPAARLALRPTGFDMDQLGLRPRDIAAQGPGIIYHHQAANGDRLLVWAE